MGGLGAPDLPDLIPGHHLGNKTTVKAPLLPPVFYLLFSPHSATNTADHPPKNNGAMWRFPGLLTGAINTSFYDPTCFQNSVTLIQFEGLGAKQTIVFV